MANIHTVTVDLSNWTRSYPTGAVAYDFDYAVTDSDYCDTVEEFADFFRRQGSKINGHTELHFVIDSSDISNASMLNFASRIADVWAAIYKEEI